MTNELRTPPHSIESEQGVLGTILLSPHSSIEKCRSMGLKRDDFYDLRHQILYGVVAELDGERVDTILIAQILRDKNVLDDIGGYDYLTELQDSAIVAGHIESYAKIVMEKHRSRLLITNCTDAIERTYCGEDTDLVAVSHIQRVESIKPAERETMDDVIDAASKELQDLAKGKVISLPFPWRNFQMRTFGIPIGSVTPMLGRDKTGKSRLSMVIAKHWIISGIPTLVFAFEDGKRRYLHALASTLGEYDSFGIRRRPSPEYLQTCKSMMERLKKLPIHVLDDSMTAEDIVATIGAYKRKHGIQAVVIDGFKDIIESKGENRTSAENHMFETIKKGALRNEVGILQIEHTHDVEDGRWLSRRNIRGSKQRSQSARMFLVYQDCGFPEPIKQQYGIFAEDDFIVLDCQAASYGDRACVVLKPELERGRFNEIKTGNVDEQPR